MRVHAVDIYFSDVFGVDPVALERYGAFNISLVNDLPLFVDPFLLFNSSKPEYQALHAGIIRYMRFLKDQSEGGIRPGLVRSWFTFPEIRQNWLGYSETGNRGHGLGLKFARALNKNFTTVFSDFGEETITLSSHLEKLCLVKDGVGRDNVSDFTTNLIAGFLGEYTERFAVAHIDETLRRSVVLARSRFDYDTRSWVAQRFELPFVDGDFVLLTPKDILTKDETWINRGELIDRFTSIADAQPNEALRAQVNEYLIRVIPRGPKTTDAEVREGIIKAIERFPAVMDFYIREKEEQGDRAVSVSAARVELVQKQFIEAVRRLVDEHLVPIGFFDIAGSTYDEAKRRVEFLKDVIENKGGHKFFVLDGKPIEREKDLQILYRLTWFGTPSDVSQETNDGRGPADYKISRGAGDKTIVEFKLAKNTQLERNLRNQTTLYEKASDATNPSLKVILFFSEAEQARVEGILKRLELTDSPNVVLIDARGDNKPSGSRA